jgi:hypothetical protein
MTHSINFSIKGRNGTLDYKFAALISSHLKGGLHFPLIFPHSYLERHCGNRTRHQNDKMIRNYDYAAFCLCVKMTKCTILRHCDLR